MPGRLPVTITEAEFERIIGKTSRRAPTGIRNRAMLVLAWEAGLRVSELCDLAPGDILRSVPAVRVRHGKGDKDRQVPLRNAALTAIEDWMRIRGQGGPWLFCTVVDRKRVSPRYVRAALARYSARAGVFKTVRSTSGENVLRPIHPHALRHSFATRMLRDYGLDLDELQQVLGHASLSSTAVYLHVSQDRLAEKMKAGLDVDGDDADLEAIVARVLRTRLSAELLGEIRKEVARAA